MADESSLLPADDIAEVSRPAGVDGQSGDYVVIARRYRPQTFDELIGQEHVARALEGAIISGRIGHAFLFCGARGTGKTSAARILAKALNCVTGPTARPCNECDICKSISTGDDVDALEIDGASNRGIDEIRELRQNVNIRPSRSRFKIYIIDEVHMLTQQAFNALLKTLEEPPAHVKFIFCTTEPDDIPITILSRCQRFDFAGVEMSAIAKRLGQICEAENADAQPEALLLLARRAAGSMRDSQSLLEQLLAFGNKRITVDDVHEMLGTAGAARLSEIVRHLAQRDAAAALADLDLAVREGVDVGQLLDQLLGYFRDLMVALAGCPADVLLYSSPGEHPELVEYGQKLGMETILAMMQILDQTIARLRYSMHGRALAEVAFVRICTLADLQAIPSLIAELRGESVKPAGAAPSMSPEGGASPSTRAVAKKKWDGVNERGSVRPPPPADQYYGPGPVSQSAGSIAAADQVVARQNDLVRQPSAVAESLLDEDQVRTAWVAALSRIGGMLAEHAQRATLAIRAPNQLVALFAPQYNFGKQYCERTENQSQLQRGLSDALGSAVRLQIAADESDTPPAVAPVDSRRAAPSRQRMAEKANHPWVKRATELFDARLVWMEEPQG